MKIGIEGLVHLSLRTNLDGVGEYWFIWLGETTSIGFKVLRGNLNQGGGRANDANL